MRLHQLLATAAPADAVTNQALAWQTTLANAGAKGQIYAENIHPDLSGRVEPLGRMARDENAAAILRYSIWSAAADRAMEVPKERLAIVYHNITPAHLLADASPAIAALCERGRRELPRLADRVALAIADSAFNARELRAAGFPEPTVIPLLLTLAPPPPARRQVPPRVLSVGRIAPSKRIEDVIRTLAILRRHLVPDARCEIVGSAEGFESYQRSLERFAMRLGIDDSVCFRGRVADKELDVAYAEAGVYLSMSVHEGFCAPLLEAASRGLPVVARGAGAVEETLGGAGVVLPSGDCALAAEAIAAVLGDAALRRELRARAAARIAELAPATVERRIVETVRPLLTA
jgi:glycosyltransferase involved in cell wall biosynthesis